MPEVVQGALQPLAV